MAEETPSMSRFHEWSLNRLQHRLQRLVWAVGALALVGVVALIWLSSSIAGVRSDVAPPDQVDLEPIVAEISALRGDVETLREQLENVDAGSPKKLLRRIRGLEIQINEVGAALTAATACLDDAIAELDDGLRRLLLQSLTAQGYVNQVTIPSCP